MREGAQACGGAQQLRLGALASSVALVAGIPDLHGGSTADVLDNLTALLSTVSAHGVTIGEHTPGAVPDAPVLALALLQLVINARRHDDATEVTIDIDPGPAFRVQWHGELPPQGVSTARHQADRDRWGLGFVRLAMDALGGVSLSPASHGVGQVTAILSVDPSPRLQLPLAAIRKASSMRHRRHGTRRPSCLRGRGSPSAGVGWWMRRRVPRGSFSAPEPRAPVPLRAPCGSPSPRRAPPTGRATSSVAWSTSAISSMHRSLSRPSSRVSRV